MKKKFLYLFTLISCYGVKKEESHESKSEISAISIRSNEDNICVKSFFDSLINYIFNQKKIIRFELNKIDSKSLLEIQNEFIEIVNNFHLDKISTINFELEKKIKNHENNKNVFRKKKIKKKYIIKEEESEENEMFSGYINNNNSKEIKKDLTIILREILNFLKLKKSLLPSKESIFKFKDLKTEIYEMILLSKDEIHTKNQLMEQQKLIKKKFIKRNSIIGNNLKKQKRKIKKKQTEAKIAKRKLGDFNDNVYLDNKDEKMLIKQELRETIKFENRDLEEERNLFIKKHQKLRNRKKIIKNNSFEAIKDKESSEFELEEESQEKIEKKKRIEKKNYKLLKKHKEEKRNEETKKYQENIKQKKMYISDEIINNTLEIQNNNKINYGEIIKEKNDSILVSKKPQENNITYTKIIHKEKSLDIDGILQDFKEQEEKINQNQEKFKEEQKEIKQIKIEKVLSREKENERQKTLKKNHKELSESEKEIIIPQKKEINNYYNNIISNNDINNIITNNTSNICSNLLDKNFQKYIFAENQTEYNSIYNEKKPKIFHEKDKIESEFNKYIEERDIKIKIESEFNKYIEERDIKIKIESEFNKYIEERDIKIKIESEFNKYIEERDIKTKIKKEEKEKEIEIKNKNNKNSTISISSDSE